MSIFRMSLTCAVRLLPVARLARPRWRMSKKRSLTGANRWLELSWWACRPRSMNCSRRGCLYTAAVKRSKLVKDNDGWKTLSSDKNFTNSHLEVVTEEVQTPNSAQARVYTTVRRKPAVVIAPVTVD